MMRGAAVAILLLAGAAIGMPVAAQTVAADRLSTGQQDIARLNGTRGDIPLTARLDRADATYRVGDALVVTVTAGEEVYLTVLNVGSSGNVTVLVPNKVQAPPRALARQPMSIPAPGASYVIRVSGPPGFDLIKVIATKEPVDVLAAERSRPAGLFRSLEKDAGALSRDLPALLERQLKDGYAVADVVIRIVDSLPPAR